MKPQQIISIFIIITTIVFEIIWITKNKKLILVVIPELSFLLHGLYFYMSIAFGWYVGFYSLWSSALRLHGYIVALILVIFRIVKGKKQWKNQD